MIPYRTVEEVDDRMGGTICMYDDAPVFVIRAIAADRGVKIAYMPMPCTPGRYPELTTPGIKTAAVTDELWRAHDFCLGYINRPIRAFYVSRIPVRRWKQGLNPHNLKPMVLLGEYHHVLSDPHFTRMLRGDYPTLRAGAAAVMLQPGIVAFDRRWAIEYTEHELYWLHYRGKQVASSQDGQSFKLPRKFLYLREAILEFGLGVVE